MQEYPSDYGRGSRRVIMALGSLVILGAAVYIVCSAAGLLPIRAEAASPNDADWSFAQPAYDSLSAQAIQVRTAENALKAAAGTENEPVRQAQVEVLSGEYNQAAQAYNEQVRSLVTAGERRPWSVQSKALPLDLAKSKFCLRVAVAAPRVVKSAVSAVQVQAAGPEAPYYAPAERFITLEQLDEYARQAGWPNEPGWWPDMRKIILCETRSLDTMAHNVNDPAGGSYGLAQLNGSYHFINAGEDFAMRYDPVVNLRTALWLRTVRGHFGGTGGWYNCAKLWGIN
ncbi:MAG TPA: hypothetical protein PKI89_04360 [Tepidiformaceae bacterium]|nr:hypothetical protein [Tepidiformaceae bacterium]